MLCGTAVAEYVVRDSAHSALREVMGRASMGTEPAVTKFRPPKLPNALVERAWLVDRLDEATASSPLTVITGYPGAGKSVLLSLWFEAHRDEDVAWWSCDSWDSSPERFWTSLVVALRSVLPDVGVDALDLYSAGSPSSAEMVASLVNDLEDLQGTTTVVIDDFDVVPPAARVGFADLVERLPPTLRIILASRSDPVLPLHRWRVSSRLSEIRMVDLRLRSDEVRQMLLGFAVDLPAAEVESLAHRTEGWAAGVQLAALSLQTVDDPSAFLRRVTGNDRHIADFLVGEVLQRQPADVQDFLLDTAILDEFDPELCDDLTDRTDSWTLLKHLEAAGLFLVPVDPQRRRFRYHHLFRDLLRAELLARDRSRADALHTRAARWYERTGELSSSIRHLVGAGDTTRAFDLLHDHSLAAWFATDGAVLEVSLNELPDSAVADQQPRMLDLALASLICGSWSRADMWLDRATRSSSPRVHDVEVESRLLVATALRMALRGEQDQAIPVARHVLDLGRSTADSTLATLVLIRCCLWTDRLDEASKLCRQGVQGPYEPVREAVLLGIESLIAFLRGGLDEAGRLAEEALRRAERAGNAHHPDLFEALYAQSGVALERGDIATAERLCEEAIRRSEPSRPPPTLLSCVLLASIWAARGDVAGAFDALERARGVLPRDAKSSLTARIDAGEARLLLDLGDRDGASVAIARLPQGTVRQLFEAEATLAGGDPAQALGLLDRVPVDPGARRVELERAVLHARIVCALGEDASGALQRVLDLGRRDRFVRSVVGRDRRYAEQLGAFLIRSRREPYSDEILRTIDQMLIVYPTSDRSDSLLSEREHAVLQYLPTRMSYREIAADLFVSMNTLKTHLKSIYRKLDASSRAEACEAARRRGLL